MQATGERFAVVANGELVRLRLLLVAYEAVDSQLMQLQQQPQLQLEALVANAARDQSLLLHLARGNRRGAFDIDL